MASRKTVITASTNNSPRYHTTIVDAPTALRCYKSLVRKLAGLIQKMHGNELVFNYGEKVTTARPTDLVRVLSEWSQDDLVDHTMRNIIVDAILSSENKLVGSGIICALALVATESVCDDRRIFHPVRAHVEDLEKCIDYFLGNGILSNLVNSSLGIGGLGASMMFEISNRRDFVLETTTAEMIEGYVHPIFKMTNRRFELPYIVCVDGIIESLGEIDHILQEAAELKCGVIVCALGYHPDVVNTLSENTSAGRLNVIPFVVQKWSTDHPDALQACAALGLTCVSPAAGEILTTQCLENFSTVRSAYISSRNVAIQNDTGNHTHMCIGIPKNMEGLAGLIEDRIRITIQACRSVSQAGLLANHSILDFAESILKINRPRVSIDALHVGLKSAQGCKEIINTLGGIVIPDPN